MNGALMELPYPTNDVRLMTKVATKAVNRHLRPGYKYSKAEVLLMDLRQPGEFTDLFTLSQPAMADKVMGVLDEINGRRGKGVLDEINGRRGKGVLRLASVPAAPGLGNAAIAEEPELHDEVKSAVDDQSQAATRWAFTYLKNKQP